MSATSKLSAVCASKISEMTATSATSAKIKLTETNQISAAGVK